MKSIRLFFAAMAVSFSVSFGIGLGISHFDQNALAIKYSDLFTGIGEAHAVTTIHMPDAFLASALQGGMNLGTDTIKCALIDITSYAQATDVYLADVTQVTGTGYTAGGQTVTSIVTAADTTNHWTTIVITPAVWTGSTTISATGAACYDSTASNRLIAISDFGGAVASSGGTYTVGAITLKFTHF